MTNMIYNLAHYNKNLKKTSHIVISIILFSLCFFYTTIRAEENIQDIEIVELPRAESPELRSYDNGKIIVLNKITATSKELNLKRGESKYFGNIRITLHKCTQNLDPYNEDNYMLFTVTEHKIDEDPISIFQGWLFSSSISISSLEHPIYEIFAQNCF